MIYKNQEFSLERSKTFLNSKNIILNKEKMTKPTKSLESFTRKKIDLILNNLGWNTDEESSNCNVFTERTKTIDQKRKLGGKFPDYVLYKSGTDEPIAIIEAKRKGQNIDVALNQGINLYAKPLGVNIIFAIDGTFVKTWNLKENKQLSVEGETVHELLPENQILQHLRDGSDIEISKEVKYSREELIKIFKWANEQLRKEGLRVLDRFIEFANILFLKLISEIEENKEIEGIEERLLARKYCWDSFASLDAERMMEYINGTVLPYLVSRYNHTGDVFQTKLQIQNPNTLKEIVDKFSKLKLLNAESEIKGDAFEYFLRELSTGNDLGEYFTPRHIVKLIVKLVNPQYGEKIYDPACGTGGFLIEAFRHIKRNCKQTREIIKKLKEDTVYGVELTNTTRIAKMNMIIIGDGHNNIIQGDSLKSPRRKGYDVVLANPPYGTTTDWGNLYPVDSKNGDVVFIEHILESLKDNDSRCAFIMQEGVLFRTSDLKLRKYILENYCIDAIISLPKGVFLPYTPVKTEILIISKRKQKEKIWCYQVKNDGFELTGLRKKIGENDIPDLIAKWENKEIGKNAWLLDVGEIKKNDYILIPEDYNPNLSEKEERSSEFVGSSLTELIELSKRLNDKLKIIKKKYNPKFLNKEHSEKYTLKYLFDMISGGTPPREEKDNFGGDINWVKIGDMHGSTKQGFMLPQDFLINKTAEKITKKGFENSNTKMIPKGTLLVSIFAFVGKASILNIDACTNQAIIGLIPKKDNKIDKKIEILPKFAYYMVLASRGNLEAVAKGGNQKNINKSKLASLKIPIPKKDIQQKVVEFLDEMNESVSETIKIKNEIETKLYQLYGDILSDVKLRHE